MAYNEKKEPLYRKVNTLARNVHHNFGSENRYDRNTKKTKENNEFGVTKSTMHGKVQRGLDYTPLFKFLLSKVGTQWNQIYSEAKSRLDKEDPIFWIVAKTEDDKKEIVRIGESSYYSGLYVDEQGLLQKVNPDFTDSQTIITCNCCTFSFNGKTLERNNNKDYSQV